MEDKGKEIMITKDMLLEHSEDPTSDLEFLRYGIEWVNARLDTEGSDLRVVAVGWKHIGSTVFTPHAIVEVYPGDYIDSSEALVL